MCIKTEKTIYRSSQVKKGQVWIVNEDAIMTAAKIKSSTHIMAKTRPYVIYGSLDNFEGCLMQGFPCTTKLKCDEIHEEDGTVVSAGNDIFFTMPNGDLSRIAANQLVSVDSHQIVKYVCTLSDDCIAELDEAVIQSFDLGKKFQHMDSQIKMLRRELDLILEQASTVFNCAIDVENRHISRTKTGNIRWTQSTMEKFIRDCNMLSRSEISKIWGIAEKTIPHYKHYCAKRLSIPTA